MNKFLSAFYHGSIIYVLLFSVALRRVVSKPRDDNFVKIFQVHLRNQNGENLRLNYELYRHSVAKKFYRLVRKLVLSPNAVIKSTAWAVFPSGTATNRILHNKLENTMNTFNEKNDLGLKFRTKLPSIESLTRYDLSLVHSEFEKLITRIYTVPTGDHNKNKVLDLRNISRNQYNELERYLNDVNGLVHSLEHVISRHSNSSSSYFTTYLSSKPLPPDIPIYKDEYKLFQLNCSFGDLLLGYGTTGKSLYHIYHDEDLALLESGGRPSPQRFITSNIMCVFYDMIFTDEDKENMFRWFAEHKIGERLGIDVYRDDNSYGYVKLGKLILPPMWNYKSKDEIVSYISPFNEVLGYGLVDL